jgi:HJR/Mrr/RecB family endonuclease
LSKRYPEADRFTRRILHQLAYQIHLLTAPLGLSENLSNTLLTTVQHILSDHSQLLLQHHLDQLVLCSAYSLSKVAGMHLKFNEIILKYREVNGYTKEVYNEIIEQVQTEGRKEDIISFYNQHFLPAMKSYMVEIKNTRLSQGKEPAA